jgi:hypothetical protein
MQYPGFRTPDNVSSVTTSEAHKPLVATANSTSPLSRGKVEWEYGNSCSPDAATMQATTKMPQPFLQRGIFFQSGISVFY